MNYQRQGFHVARLENWKKSRNYSIVSVGEGAIMAEERQVSAPSVFACVELTTAELKFKFRANVPVEPIQLRGMLPLIQEITDTVVDGASRVSAENGQPISCRAGCGACCRQLVAIGESEAHYLRDLVHALPEPRQSEVLARFARARQRLQEVGLLDSLLHPVGLTKRHGMTYFRLGISCPFLEKEICSIYSDRPIICREFLVTSPAENCSHPTPETVHRVRLPLRLMTAVARFMPELDPPRFVLPVPLILALDWADEHPDVSPPRTGLEWLGEIVNRLRIYEEGLLQPESVRTGTVSPEAG